MIGCMLTMVSVPASAQTVSADALAFGARPAVDNVSLSPAGMRIAFVAPTVGQAATLYTVPTEQGAEPKASLAVTGAPDRLSKCRFVSEARLVCSIFGVIQAPGLETPLTYNRVFATDASGGKQRMLSNRQINQRYSVQDGGDIIDWLPAEDGNVLMRRFYARTDTIDSNIGSLREGDGVDRLDTQTGKRTVVERPRPNIAEYITDGRGNVRIAGYYDVAGSTGQITGKLLYRYRKAGSTEWLEMGTYDTVSEEGFNPYAVDAASDAVYGFRKKDGRKALYRRALDGSDAETLIFARTDVDVDGLVRIGRDQHVVGVSYATDRRQVEYFDPVVRAQLAALHKALPALPIIEVVDTSKDGTRLLVFAASDNDPGRYYLFDAQAKRLQLLMEARPQLHGRTLSRVQAIRYPARDGTMIPGYLTLPSTGPGTGLPAIVLPHGGPSARDEWGFDWLAQFFAARGYAVLQPNYRGSSGYGDAYLMTNAFQSWRTAVGDIADAGRWLASQGIAAKDKLAIVGWSYGGYAALQSATIDPALFKAVVAIAPVTDLATLKDSRTDFANDRINRNFIGTVSRDASPAQNAGRLEAPVLLFHGTLDANVPYRQSTLMQARLQNAGKRVELVTFEGLDHHLDDSVARASMLDRADRFIRRALGY